jgi:hypothetical protein
MTEGKKIAEESRLAALSAKNGARAVWEKPELRFMEARDAEGASGAGGDNVIYS